MLVVVGRALTIDHGAAAAIATIIEYGMHLPAADPCLAMMTASSSPHRIRTQLILPTRLISLPVRFQFAIEN
eukprot:scaffold32475_cov74-Cyclotella_meneghiniana.AAC.3